MDPNLYSSARYANVDLFPNQYNNQLHQQLTLSDKSNFLHVCAQFHDSAEFVRDVLNDQSSQVQRSMLTWHNSMNETALHVASRNGRYNIVQLLIQRMETLDQEDLEGAVKITEAIMRATDLYGDTVVHKAAGNNRKEVAKLLLTKDPFFEHPVNVIGETPLFLAIDRGYFVVVDSILNICTSPGYQGPLGFTVLHAAVISNNVECVKKILRKYPNLTTQADNSGWIPLHCAANFLFAKPGLIRTLLQADPSTAYITTRDHQNGSALHFAAAVDKDKEMKEILEVCPDSWNMVTSMGQNILHFAAKNKSEQAIIFILGQDWAINLINHQDSEGNTPLHLYLNGNFDSYSNPSTLPLGNYEYSDRSSLLVHPLLDWEVINRQNTTPLDLLFTPKQDRDQNLVTPYQQLFRPGNLVHEDVSESWQLLGEKLQGKLKAKSRMAQGVIKYMMEDLKKGWTEEKHRRLKELRDKSQTHLLVATLIATVTFAAGFTLPGGYDGNAGPNQGMAVLIKKAAFKMFLVTDAIAVLSSLVAVFLHFTATSIDDDKKLYRRYSSALLLIIIAMITMVIAFIMGLYVVLHGSLSLAIGMCILGSFPVLVFSYMIIHDAPFLLGGVSGKICEMGRRVLFWIPYKQLYGKRQ